jgi:FkbM family methyltransferase
MAEIIWKIELYWLAKQMRILPALTVCECSVGPLEISTSPPFVGECDRLLLIEPEPHMAQEASRALGTKVLQVAVGMQPGKQMMVYNNGSSYLKGTWAPTLTGTREFEVDVVTFDTLDDGQIDILNLDCEGQEWAVLSHMKSEPKLLAVENMETNPYHKEICQWLKDHKYIMRFFTGPWAETQIYTKS